VAGRYSEVAATVALLVYDSEISFILHVTSVELIFVMNMTQKNVKSGRNLCYFMILYLKWINPMKFCNRYIKNFSFNWVMKFCFVLKP